MSVLGTWKDLGDGISCIEVPLPDLVDGAVVDGHIVLFEYDVRAEPSHGFNVLIGWVRTGAGGDAVAFATLGWSDSDHLNDEASFGGFVDWQYARMIVEQRLHEYCSRALEVQYRAVK